MVLFEMSRGMAMNLLDNKERRDWFWNQRRSIICIRLNPDFTAYVNEGRVRMMYHLRINLD